jgi:hypothetical protein
MTILQEGRDPFYASQGTHAVALDVYYGDKKAARNANQEIKIIIQREHTGSNLRANVAEIN